MNIWKIFSLKHVIAKIRFLVAPLIKYEQMIICHGHEFYLDLRNYPQRGLWAYRNLYDFNEVALLRRYLKPGDVFVDVGANAGLYSKVAAEIVGTYGKVISLEADPKALPSLYKNLEPYSQKFIMEAFITDSDEATSRVKNAARLDDILEGPVNFLKIDIDGPELKALKGGETIIRRCKPIILLEISPDSEDRHGIHFSEVVHWLECLNYSVYKPTINLEKFDACEISVVQNIVFLPK